MGLILWAKNIAKILFLLAMQKETGTKVRYNLNSITAILNESALSVNRQNITVIADFSPRPSTALRVNQRKLKFAKTFQNLFQEFEGGEN